MEHVEDGLWRPFMALLWMTQMMDTRVALEKQRNVVRDGCGHENSCTAVREQLLEAGDTAQGSSYALKDNNIN